MKIIKSNTATIEAEYHIIHFFKAATKISPEQGLKKTKTHVFLERLKTR